MGSEQTKKGPDYYESLKEKYEEFIAGNELLAVPSVMEAVNTKRISLLMTDVELRKFIGVSREGMEETLKNLNIRVKVLARRSNTMWDVLLVSEEEAKSLAGSILAMKAVRLQTEYMGTWKTWITIH